MVDELMNPIGICRYEKKPIAPRLGDLKNKVLGLVDNSKSNADLFLNQVQEVLCQSYVFADILRIKKSAGSVPASFAKEFFERCHLVINAFGD